MWKLGVNKIKIINKVFKQWALKEDLWGEKDLKTCLYLFHFQIGSLVLAIWSISY